MFPLKKKGQVSSVGKLPLEGDKTGKLPVEWDKAMQSSIPWNDPEEQRDGKVTNKIIWSKQNRSRQERAAEESRGIE